MNVTNSIIDAIEYYLLAGQMSREENRVLRRMFWEMLPAAVSGKPACLPGLAVAVRQELREMTCVHGVTASIDRLACLSFPARLPAESMPWFHELTNAWEAIRQTVRENEKKPAEYQSSLLALARLDACGMEKGLTRPSRLPELLLEADHIANHNRTNHLSDFDRLDCLAALAVWKPVPGVITNPEVLDDWIAFWVNIYQENDPLAKGVAAKALLNVTEGRVKSASVPHPAGLLADLAKAIPEVAQRVVKKEDDSIKWLEWQPRSLSHFPLHELKQVVQAWLRAGSDEKWEVRQVAQQQLIRWDRAGFLSPCGIDLLPHLITAVKTEDDYSVLWALSRWEPMDRDALPPAHRQLLRELVHTWRQHGRHWHGQGRAAVWQAEIQLHQAGLLPESLPTFQKECLKAIREEEKTAVLLTLMQWFPAKDAPPGIHKDHSQAWQERLKDEHDDVRQVAGLALIQSHPDNDPDSRWQHLHDALQSLPEEVCPKISVTEVLTRLTGQSTPLVTDPTEKPRDGRWQVERDKAIFQTGQKPFLS